jgi:cytochrome c biogenesis protein CcmG, thiol:disulfide interchange protein DsbE
MTKALRFVLPLAIFLVLAVFLYVGLSRDPRDVPSPLIGKAAPEFSLATLQDESKLVTRKDFAGKPWVLNVWASWCAPCRDEHPLLVEWSKRTRVPIVGLHYKEDKQPGLRWLQQLGNPYAVTLHDREGRVAIDWGVYGVPETFVIDPQGMIRFKHKGPLTAQIIRERIEPLLAQWGGAAVQP